MKTPLPISIANYQVEATKQKHRFSPYLGGACRTWEQIVKQFIAQSIPGRPYRRTCRTWEDILRNLIVQLHIEGRAVRQPHLLYRSARTRRSGGRIWCGRQVRAISLNCRWPGSLRRRGRGCSILRRQSILYTEPYYFRHQRTCLQIGTLWCRFAV